jgi:hypothetical protein
MDLMFRLALAGSALVAMLLAGCGTSGEEESGGSSNVSLPADAILVSSVDSIPDAKERRFDDAVSILVPTTMRVSTEDFDDAIRVKFSDGDGPPPVTLTVSRAGTTVDDDIVKTEIQSIATGFRLAGINNIEQHPVGWDDLPTGWGFTALVTAGDGSRWDYLCVGLRNNESSRMVIVSVTAPVGELDDSVYRQVFATLRFL